jgi:hypothetical protein
MNRNPEAIRGRAAQPYDDRIDLSGPPFDDGGPLPIRFEHGLGDSVESLSMRQLFVRFPRVHVMVQVPRAFAGIYHDCPWTTVVDGDGQTNWDRIERHGHYFACHWWEAHESYADRPSTKAEKCLREVFGPDAVTRHFAAAANRPG